MDFELIKNAAQAYRADMSRFLRDMIRIPSESCEEEGVVMCIKAEMEKLGYDKVEIDALGNIIGWMGDGDKIIVNKEVEEGVQIVSSILPCVVTYTKPAWDLRHPTLKRKMAANKAEIPNITAADLPTIDLTRAGLKGSPTKVKKTFVPAQKTGGVKIQEETAADSAKKLFSLMSDAGLI